MTEPMSAAAKAAAAAAVASGITAETMHAQPEYLGIPVAVLLWAFAGAFAGLARTDPATIKSLIEIGDGTAWQRALKWLAGVCCLLVTVGSNAALGVAVTVLLPHAFGGLRGVPLWPVAVLISFGMQKLAPKAVDAAGDAIAQIAAGWAQRLGKAKKPTPEGDSE